MEFSVLRRRWWPVLPGLMALLLAGCEKEIEVDLPVTEARIVVEGSVETGRAPIVLLTRTQSFFEPTSAASLARIFVTEAVVRINEGGQTHELQKICSAALPPELLEEAAMLTGFAPELLAAANICIWTHPTLVGENGRTYELSVQVEEHFLTSTTTIPQPVALDSIWFRLAQQQAGDDSLGYIWITLSDPDTMGNAYRWFAQRLNRDDQGRPKDQRYVAPLLGTFEDRYINGLTLDLSFYRGRAPYTSPDAEPAGEASFFKRNDTVAVKLASMGLREFQFFDSYANNFLTQGDIFSTPANIRTNIEGGLGIWVGYGIHPDTVICVP